MDVNYTHRRQLEHTFTKDQDGNEILNVCGLYLDTITYVAGKYTLTLEPLKFDDLAHVYATNKPTTEQPGQESGQTTKEDDKLKVPEDSMSKASPLLPHIHQLATGLRRIYTELLAKYLHGPQALLSPFFRCLDEDMFSANVDETLIPSFRCLLSRAPIETSLLFYADDKGSSLEVCKDCTQGLPFSSRLEALYCPHLPMLYETFGLGSPSKVFVLSDMRRLRDAANLNGT
jgi:hypothetical protein